MTANELQPPLSTHARPLAELVAGMVNAPVGVMITDMTLDSRAVRPGTLFLACRGHSHHGIEFAEQAAAQGARAVLYDSSSLGSTRVPQLGSQVFVAGVPELAKHVGALADRFFDAPSEVLSLSGITGTNGKTTCAYLLAQALTKYGRPAAYIGTLGFGMPNAITPSGFTTADSVSVHRQLAELRALGAECVGMEVSSHALEQGRVDGVRFRSAAFTNLTRDHLDYHGSMEAYGAAKRRLFEWETLAARVINIDDAFGAQLAEKTTRGRLVVTTRSQDATRLPRGAALPRDAEVVAARNVQLRQSGLSFDIESSWGSATLNSPLVGEFNVENLLTVLALLLSEDVPLQQAVHVLGQCAAPPGRLETFGGQGVRPLAIVDYAHTPDALAKALRAARAHCRGRLRVVFGCGGDRDPGKRPQMGRIAIELADDVILTDDNPRSEDPQRIVADILAGIGERAAVSVEHDRAQAIRSSLERSGPDDVVLIAGKGHEDYQIVGTQRRAFSDQAVVRAYFGGQG